MKSMCNPKFLSALLCFILLISCDISYAQADRGGCTPPAGPQHPRDNNFPDEDSWPVEILSSFDPNEIIGPDGYDTLRWVAVKDNMGYTINFENDPMLASAPAKNVYLFYPVSPKHDITSFRVGSYGFNGEVFAVPANRTFYSTQLDLKSTLGILVNVTAGIDVVNSRAFWIFESIDPLTGLSPEDALVGLLPIKDSTITELSDTVAVPGEGFVNFTIKPKSNSLTGEEVLATAKIVFDTNDTIPTNVAQNILDALPPQSHITVAPGSGNSVTLHFAATDDGSGVKNYDLYVAQDSSNYNLYLTNSTEANILFKGVGGSRYHFFSVATDNTGNREALKSSPDASVTLTGLSDSAWYADADGDGFGNPNVDSLSVTQPVGYVANNTDCNDEDPTIHEPQQFYVDADHDGFGSNGTEMLCASTPPIGYSINNTDCNDADPTIHEPMQFYVDADHDGFGSSVTEMLCASIAPIGYSTNNTDCNDEDPIVHEPQQFYVDADHDGYGSIETEMLCTSTPPVGYSTNNTDCNYEDPTIHEPQQFYVDADLDGFGSIETAMLCTSTPPVGYSTNNTDCNDEDPTVHEPLQFFVDGDYDGFGSHISEMLCTSIAPIGYSTNNTDCNDRDGTIHGPHQYYVDADLDGFGSNGTEMLCTSTPPVGYSTNNTDCNDEDPTVHGPQQFYVDADHDGFGSGETEMLCTSTPPVGYSTNNTDCNDEDPTVHEPLQFYVDADLDGFGSTETEMLCTSTPPIGYSTNNTDCNDEDPTVHEPQQFYVDADHDGYGSIETAMLCTSIPQVGYSNNNADCNDNDASIHPESDEIPCNDIDDNCNGLVDENNSSGCTNSMACNYDPNATCDDGSCYFGAKWFADKDNDGYGDGSDFIFSCLKPAGYISDSTDCNDAQLQYADLDDDGFGAGSPVACGVPNNGDCDDNDASINSNTVWYLDLDNDGYYTGAPVSQCMQPGIGYKYNGLIAGGDCDDSNEMVNPGATETCNGIDDNCSATIDEGLMTTLYYRDSDGDLYGDETFDSLACIAPVGYVLDNNDCDDSNASINPNTVWYLDLDNDGYYRGAPVTQCMQPGIGYKYNGLIAVGDCDDSNEMVNPGATEVCNGIDDNCTAGIDEGLRTVYYRDADGDGYGNGALDSLACSQPFGYVVNNTDCDDSNSSISPVTNWYLDADDDGYYSNIVTQCVQPAVGYKYTGLIGAGDCNDNDASIKPGVTEVCNNGIDDNCDIQIDEGCNTCMPPLVTGTISGPSEGVCKNTTKSYSVVNQSGVVFTWNVPSNATIESGQGTHTITVKFKAQFVAGTLSVVASNSCGINTPSQLAISSVPAVPSAIIGPSSVCQNATHTYSSTVVSGADLYSWKGAGVMITSLSDDNRIVSVKYKKHGATLQVQVKNACGSSAYQSLVVNTNSCAAKTDENEEEMINIISGTSVEAYLRAYPNPFSDRLNIEFALPEPGKARLEIFNVTGQLLATLFDGDVIAGEVHRIEFITNALARGIVFYRLQTETETYYDKVMMMK